MARVFPRVAAQLRTAVRKIFATVCKELLPKLTPVMLSGFAADVVRTETRQIKAVREA